MIARNFVFQGCPQRVTFGTGTRHALGSELARLGITSVLIITGERQQEIAEQLRDSLTGLTSTVFAGARMHTPVETTETALALLSQQRINGLVAVGGGSSIGLMKALAHRTDLPQIALPTTYAGSEATDILGETVESRKVTRRDPRILPEVVIYDVDLTVSLPARASACSGLNALAHGVEAMYAHDGSPLTSLMARAGLSALAKALPVIAADPGDTTSRVEALYGAWLCGMVLRSTSMALHHKLCHVLGGTFGLPHAETHAIILPHAVAFNSKAAAEATDETARAIGTRNAARGIFDLGRQIGAPASLREIGMPNTGLDDAVDNALAQPYWNPRPLDREGVRGLLDDAWHGRPPRDWIL
jgi:alcohol dehydrogenase class IV